jgi:putative nucleotidyltransferase with HDIG domain
VKIFLSVSNEYLKDFLTLFPENVEFVTSEKADIHIIEISSLKELLSQPRRIDKIRFFLISNKDKSIITQLKNFQINGIIVPPLNKKTIFNKLTQSLKNTHPSSVADAETLKSKIIAKAESIPPLPIVVQELLRLMSDVNVDLKTIIMTLKKDQGLTAKVLKLVNSPFFGLKQEITSIDRGVVLLGIRTIKSLIMALTTQDFYKKNFAVYGQNGTDLWIHGFATARFCETISSILPTKLDKDALYLSGLMHDIGKTVLVDFLVQKVETYEDETKQVNINHMEVGAIVLKKWGVAEFITESVRNHHFITEDYFSNAVYYSNLIANNMEEPEDIIKEIADFFNLNYEITKEKIEIVIEECQRENFPF